MSVNSSRRDSALWRLRCAAAGASLCFALACGCEPAAPAVEKNGPPPAATPSARTEAKPAEAPTVARTETKPQTTGMQDSAKDPPLAAAAPERPSGSLDKSDSLVTPHVTVDPASVRAGSVFTIRVEVQIQPGWHIYAVDKPTGPSIPTSIDFKLPKTLSWDGDWAVSEPALDDAHPDEPAFVYQGSASFSRRVHAARDAPSGAVSLRGKLGYQACDKFSCRAPTHTDLQANLKIAP